MNKFTEEEEFQLIKLMDEAEALYFRYVASCEKIEEFLNDKNPEEKDFMKEVFYSLDDQCLCVSYNRSDNVYLGKAIPIFRYIDCFEMDDYEAVQLHCYPGVGTFEVDEIWKKHIENCEKLRLAYIATKNKCFWKELIRLLPESWLQKRTVTMNYENVLTMYHQRKNHKLNEWSGKDDPTKPNFCSWVLELPYARQFFIEPFEKGETKK